MTFILLFWGHFHLLREFSGRVGEIKMVLATQLQLLGIFGLNWNLLCDEVQIFLKNYNFFFLLSLSDVLIILLSYAQLKELPMAWPRKHLRGIQETISSPVSVNKKTLFVCSIGYEIYSTKLDKSSNELFRMNIF